MKSRIKRLLIALFASLPVAFVGFCNAGLAGGDVYLTSLEFWHYALIISAIALPFIATVSYSYFAIGHKLIKSRSFRAVPLVVFMAPLFVVIDWRFGPDLLNPIFSKSLGFVFSIIVGSLISWGGIAAARAFKREAKPADREMPFTKAGRIILVVAALTGAGLGVVAFNIVSSQYVTCVRQPWTRPLSLCHIGYEEGYAAGITAGVLIFMIGLAIALALGVLESHRQREVSTDLRLIQQRD